MVWISSSFEALAICGMILPLGGLWTAGVLRSSGWAAKRRRRPGLLGFALPPLRHGVDVFPIVDAEAGSCACGGAPRISEMYCRWCSLLMAVLLLFPPCWSSRAEVEDFSSVFNPSANSKVMPALCGSGDSSNGGASAACDGWRSGLVPQGPVCIFLSCWGALYHCSVAI